MIQGSGEVELRDLTKVLMFMLEMHGGAITLSRPDIEKIYDYDISRLQTIRQSNPDILTIKIGDKS